MDARTSRQPDIRPATLPDEAGTGSDTGLMALLREERRALLRQERRRQATMRLAHQAFWAGADQAA